MSITTYAELVTAIQNWTADTTTATSTQIDDFIRLAEARIFNGAGKAGDAFFSRGLRCKAMERRVSLVAPNYQTVTTVGGTANAQTVSWVTIPSGNTGLAFTFNAIATNTGAMTLTANGTLSGAYGRGLNYDALEAGDVQSGGLYAAYYDGTQFVAMPGNGCVPLPTRFVGGRMMFVANTTRKIPFINSDDSQALALTVNGAYTVEEGAIRFVSVPASTVVDFRYYRRPLPLITAVNDIFRDAPNLWLYGALLEAALFIQNDAFIGKYYSLFMAAMAGYMETDAEVRSGTEQTFNQAYTAIV